jgi:general secretion pathway protein A
MYRAFYGLEKKPFQISADPEFLWLGPKHKEGLAILIYGVSDNKGFLVLSGGVGTGKTTLIHALLRQLDDSVVVASVPDPGLSLIEFYRYIASSFGMKGKYTSKVDFLFDFEAFLKNMHAKGRVALLIIDEAQRLDATMLDEIRLLSNIELPEQKLLNIFFVGQEEFLRNITAPRNRALKQRITINHHLSPLSLEETRMFIDYRLQVAGATRPIFEEAAIEGIYAFSRGHPRRINIICDHALLTGFVEEHPTIGADIIAECATELMLPGERPKDGHPSAAIESSHLSPSSPGDSRSSLPINSTAPAILGEALLDAPASEPRPKLSRERIFTLVTALLVTFLAAIIYLKPQLEIGSPPERAEIAAMPSTSDVNVEPAASARKAYPPSDPQGEEPAERSGTGEPPEVSVDRPPTPEVTREVVLKTIPPDRTISGTVADTPPAAQVASADAVDPQVNRNPSAVASAVSSEPPPVTAELSSEKENDRSDPRSIEATRRPSLETATAAATPQGESPASPPAAVRTETAPESASPKANQDVRREQTPALAVENPARVAGRMSVAPETPNPQPPETYDPVLSMDERPPVSDRTGVAATGDSSTTPSALPRSNAPGPLSSGEASAAQNVAVAPTPPVPVGPAATPPVAESQGPTSVERLEKFLQVYCEAYSTKNLERFAALFAPNAVERDQPFVELLPVYRANFAKLDEVRYQIDMQSYAENADGSEIRIKGDFRMRYRLEGRDWKAFGGDIEMDLVKISDDYRVKRLDYQKRN